MSATSKPQFLSSDTEYHSVSSLHDNDQPAEGDALEPKLELGDHPQMRVERSWRKTILLQIFSLLWLAPILALLILNLGGHIIGASAWCPEGRCWVEAFNPDTAVPEQRMHRFDHDDHNLLGALQLVAKALEVWFELIAGALVYLVTMLLAGKKEGLPIGYLTRPNEFSDLVGLLDPLLWSSLPRKGRMEVQPYHKRASRIRIWAFILMTIALCVLCNLMGPATAVLVIPSLQWIEAKKVYGGTFSYLNSAEPPSLTGAAMNDTWNCSPANFTSNSYSCAAYDWADKLDAWATSWLAAAAEGSYTTINWEDQLTFTYNATTNNTNATDQNYIYWVPNRQLVRTFNDDLTNIQSLSQGYNASDAGVDADVYETYVLYNKSLQLELQRNGPILGTYFNAWSDVTGNGSWTTIIDSGRALQCFDNYYFGEYQDTEYTKCIQDGGGWGPHTLYANFTVAGTYDIQDATIEPSVQYEVFSSDRVAFLANGSMPSGVSQDCITAGQVPEGTECDWDALFDARAPTDNVKTNVTTLRMTMILDNVTAVLAVDYVAYYNFTNYTLDTSLSSNPLHLVQTQSTPSSGYPVAINPAWTLAAWAVDNGGTLPANRSTATMLRAVMLNTANSALDDDDDVDEKFVAITFLPVLQTLSMIEYETTIQTPTPKKLTKALIDDPVNPVLYRKADMYVWAYGMSSRTAYLGVLVAILGVLVVLTQFVLGLVDRRWYRSPTQLLVAALEHAPKDEFKGLEREEEHNEEKMARVRFHVRAADTKAGKFTFHPPIW